MKVTIDGTKYVVWFDYIQARLDNGTPVQRTMAWVGTQSPTKTKNVGGREVPVVEAMIGAHADCSPEDQFVKAKGRKIALTRLVARMAERDWEEKELRVQFWQQAFVAMPSLRS